MKENKRLQAAVDRLDKAKMNVTRVSQEEYPLSSIVYISHGRGQFKAQVIGHHIREVEVINLKSGKKTWRPWYDVSRLG